jgi:hypothetical protein
MDAQTGPEISEELDG